MNLHSRARSKRRRGSALIELAVVLPILCLLFLGAWSIGYSCYTYTQLEGAVRFGARYASLSNYDVMNPSAFHNAVKNAVVFGDPAGGAKPVISGLNTSQVNVAVTPSTGQPVSVRVSISGYQLFGPWMNRFNLGNKPWVEIPFLGNYIPV